MKWSTFSNIADCVAGAVASVVVGEVAVCAVVPEVVVGVGYHVAKDMMIKTKINEFKIYPTMYWLRDLWMWSKRHVDWSNDVFDAALIEFIREKGLGDVYDELRS